MENLTKVENLKRQYETKLDEKTQDFELAERDFKNEKELQNFFEENIGTILGCKFIDTEFVVGDFRIDTLAFDEEAK